MNNSDKKKSNEVYVVIGENLDVVDAYVDLKTAIDEAEKALDYPNDVVYIYRATLIKSLRYKLDITDKS